MHWGRTPRLLIVGDVIVDEYRHLAYDRPSPEAALPIMRLDRTEVILGGAGAVATMAAQLGAEVEIACPQYRVWYEGRIWKLLKDAGVRRLDGAGQVNPDPPYHELPCVKTRYLVDGKPCGFRLDDDHFAEWRSMAAVGRVLFASAVLVADYGKGAVSAELFAALAKECHARNVPLLVDPARGQSWAKYAGATVIKANAAERADWDGGSYSRHVIITQGSRGMELDGELIPAEPCEVRDVTGAGDAVLAALGCAVGAGVDLRESCRWANQAAGLKLKNIGATLGTSLLQ